MLIAAISSMLFSCGYVFGRITTLFSSYNVFMSVMVIRYQQTITSLRKTWSKTKHGWESRILKYVRYLLKFAYFYDP